MDKKILRKWLKAGYIEGRTLHLTEEGTPQGGIISPCLLTMTLRGMELDLKKRSPVKNPEKVNMVVYADDFIVTGSSKEVLENKVKPALETFLKERGLTLSNEKTKITHIKEGFDFLGFNVRKYKGKLIIKPSIRHVKDFLSSIRKLIGKNGTVKTDELIRQLNPKLRGWANYFRHVVAKRTFQTVDHFVFDAIWRWAKRRHPKKGARWVRKKYFRTHQNNHWMFFARILDKDGKTDFLHLFKVATIPIRRHVKIRAEANPYNIEYMDYFNHRETRKRKPGSG